MLLPGADTGYFSTATTRTLARKSHGGIYGGREPFVPNFLGVLTQTFVRLQYCWRFYCWCFRCCRGAAPQCRPPCGEGTYCQKHSTASGPRPPPHNVPKSSKRRPKRGPRISKSAKICAKSAVIYVLGDLCTA